MNGKETRFWLFLCVLWMVACVVILGMVNDAKAGERWAVVGDHRTTAVMNAGIPGDPFDSTWMQIQRFHVPVEIVNLAADTGGWAYRYDLAQARFLAVLSLGVKGVIINLGTYDWATNNTPDRMKQFMRAAIPQLKAAGLQVVCLTPLYHPDERTLHGPLSAKGYQLNYIPTLPGSVQRPSYAALMAAECNALGAKVIGGRNAPIGFPDVSAPLGTTVKPYILTTGGHGKLAVHIVQAMQAMGYWLP